MFKANMAKFKKKKKKKSLDNLVYLISLKP